MAIAKVQSKSKSVGFVGNNTTLAFDSNVTAGNLLVVTHAHWGASGIAISTPTDTLGHTYLPVAAEQSAGGGLVRLRSFYVANCSGGANTVTFDAAGTDTVELAVVISEFSGVATSSPLDTTNVGTGTGTAVSSGNVTPSVDNCLLYGGMSDDSNNVGITEEAGWTLIHEEIPAGSIPVATAFKVQTTATAEDADWTLASSKEWIAHVGVFKPEVAAAGHPAVKRMGGVQFAYSLGRGIW